MSNYPNPGPGSRNKVNSPEIPANSIGTLQGAEIPGVAPRLPGPASATFCFLLVLVFFNLVGYIGSRFLNLSSIWITFTGEIAFVLAIPLLFTLLGRYNFKRVFNFNKINPGTLGLCILVGLSAQLAVRFPSFISIWVLQIFGPLYLPNQYDDGTLPGRLFFAFVAVILAPLCEETLNRGFIMAGYRRAGFWPTVIVVGLFFGFFHQYPYRLIDTFIAGLILGYLALITNSIFASMAAHLGFNLLPSIVNFFRDDLNEMQRANPKSQLLNPDIIIVSSDQILGSLILSLVGSALVFLLVRKITRRSALSRPGIVISYSGLAREILENVPTFENGAYWGPPNLPYRYGQFGYIYNWVPVPYPSLPRPVAGTRFLLPPKRGSRAGLFLAVVLILALFAFSSFTELVLRARGREYCRVHPSECLALTSNETVFEIRNFQWDLPGKQTQAPLPYQFPGE